MQFHKSSASSFFSMALRCLYIGVCILLASCTLDQKSTDFIKNIAAPRKITQRDDASHKAIIEKYGGIYQHSGLEGLINTVLTRLVSVLQHPRHFFSVTVLNSPGLNAFSLPNGSLYITRGLLTLANDSSELAAVLAHEMAHVIAHHGLVRQKKLKAAKIGRRIVDEALGDSISTRIALMANQLRFLEFSREQELEADALGIRMIGHAGYDPYASSRFLKAMESFFRFKRRGRNLESSTNFFSAHPGTPKRIEYAKKHARFFGSPEVKLKNRKSFLTGISGILFGNHWREGFVRNDRFIHLELGIAFSVPEKHTIHNLPAMVTITGPNEMATRFDSVIWHKNHSLDSYLKSPWVKGLVKSSVRSLKINGFEAVTALAKNGGWNFSITLIGTGTRFFRFISVSPKLTYEWKQTAHAIASSFHRLSIKEEESYRPLRLRIVTVGEGDSLRSMAKRMHGMERPLTLLRLLNRLQQNEKLQPGDRLKIVVED